MLKLRKLKKRKLFKPEEEIQVSVIDKVLRPLSGHGMLEFFHCPNQLAGRGDNLRKIMGRLGVRSGVPDLFVLIKGGLLIQIELKVKGEKQNDNQIIWQNRVTALGFKYFLVTCSDKFDGQKQVTDILRLNGVPV